MNQDKNVNKIKNEKNGSATDIKNYIDVQGVLKTLEDHIIQNREMSATQVKAALEILKKAFPDKEGQKTSLSMDEMHEIMVKDMNKGG